MIFKHFEDLYSYTIHISYYCSSVAAGGQIDQERSFLHVNHGGMNLNDVLSALLALSPTSCVSSCGPWQALHADLPGIYVLGSCTPR